MCVCAHARARACVCVCMCVWVCVCERERERESYNIDQPVAALPHFREIPFSSRQRCNISTVGRAKRPDRTTGNADVIINPAESADPPINMT